MTGTGEELLSDPRWEEGREWTRLEILRPETCMVVPLTMSEYGVRAECGWRRGCEAGKGSGASAWLPPEELCFDLVHEIVLFVRFLSLTPCL